MRCLYHVFSWLTQCNQTFPLADCSEENPVPYRAGNRDHRVTDGTQNCACNRGNTDALHRVKYPVHRTGKLFTGLPPDRFRAQLVLQAGHQGTGGMVGKRCHERTDQRIQFPAGAGRYGNNRMYGPEQPEYRICFFANVLFLCGRRLNTCHIPFMAGLCFVGLRHHKQHLLMSPVQYVSPEILIHRQGTVIGFNQPQYQVQFRQNVTVQGFILCIPVPALATPGRSVITML